MTKEEAKSLRAAVGGNYCNWNFDAFCKAMGFRDDYYSQGKWSAFLALSKYMAEFDDERLATIFTREGQDNA